MELRNQQTGAIISDSEFRALHSNTSFPAIIDYAAMGYDVIFQSPYPEATPHQTIVRQGVIQVDTKWYTNYVVVDLSPEACAAKDAEQAAAVRVTRNVRLAACDWTQVDDAPFDNTGKAAWSSYRQALRDISKQPGFPWAITWPVEPQ